jgi:uncharacterized protein YbbK (DUF523 family)
LSSFPSKLSSANNTYHAYNKEIRLTDDVKAKQQPIRIGISSCLLGEKVRYDGGHKLDRFLRDTLGQYVQYVPVCPEVECGLGVPREPMHLAGDPDIPRLVVTRTGDDVTGRMDTWCRIKILELEKMRLSAFVLKSRSPSCGIGNVKLLSDKGEQTSSGTGLFARMIIDRFPQVRVEESDGLLDPVYREQFMEMLLGLKPVL